MSILRLSFCKQNVQISASNGSVIEAHRFEYRTLSHITPAFPVCVEDASGKQRTIIQF